MLRFSCVSRFVKVTVASATAAPLESVAVPLMVPYTFWPNPLAADIARSRIAAADASQRLLTFRMDLLLEINSNVSGPATRMHQPEVHILFGLIRNEADHENGHRATPTPAIAGVCRPARSISQAEKSILDR